LKLKEISTQTGESLELKEMSTQTDESLELKEMSTQTRCGGGLLCQLCKLYIVNYSIMSCVIKAFIYQDSRTVLYGYGRN